MSRPRCEGLGCERESYKGSDYCLQCGMSDEVIKANAKRRKQVLREQKAKAKREASRKSPEELAKIRAANNATFANNLRAMHHMNSNSSWLARQKRLERERVNAEIVRSTARPAPRSAPPPDWCELEPADVVINGKEMRVLVVKVMGDRVEIKGRHIPPGTVVALSSLKEPVA